MEAAERIPAFTGLPSQRFDRSGIGLIDQPLLDEVTLQTVRAVEVCHQIVGYHSVEAGHRFVRGTQGRNSPDSAPVLTSP